MEERRKWNFLVLISKLRGPKSGSSLETAKLCRWIRLILCSSFFVRLALLPRNLQEIFDLDAVSFYVASASVILFPRETHYESDCFNVLERLIKLRITLRGVEMYEVLCWHNKYAYAQKKQRPVTQWPKEFVRFLIMQIVFMHRLPCVRVAIRKLFAFHSRRCKYIMIRFALHGNFSFGYF